MTHNEYRPKLYDKDGIKTEITITRMSFLNSAQEINVTVNYVYNPNIGETTLE